MKTYGVNRFLVWVGLLILFCPVYLWAEAFLLQTQSPYDLFAGAPPLVPAGPPAI